MFEQSYEPIVPTNVGNRRASARSGHGAHGREGGNKRTNLLKGDIAGAQNPIPMSTDINRIAELANSPGYK
jgi:hypothetical protein